MPEATEPIVRFARKFVIDEDSGCWLWTGYIRGDGYGDFYVGGEHRPTMTAHRAAYLMVVGPIPEGLQLDHLCRNRACVNPDHLEPVTPRENLARSENVGGIAVRTGVCHRGHRMDDAYVKPNGFRQCRTCKRDTMRKIRAVSR